MYLSAHSLYMLLGAKQVLYVGHESVTFLGDTSYQVK